MKLHHLMEIDDLERIDENPFSLIARGIGAGYDTAVDLGRKVFKVTKASPDSAINKAFFDELSDVEQTELIAKLTKEGNVEQLQSLLKNKAWTKTAVADANAKDGLGLPKGPGGIELQEVIRAKMGDPTAIVSIARKLISPAMVKDTEQLVQTATRNIKDGDLSTTLLNRSAGDITTSMAKVDVEEVPVQVKPDAVQEKLVAMGLKPKDAATLAKPGSNDLPLKGAKYDLDTLAKAADEIAPGDAATLAKPTSSDLPAAGARATRAVGTKIDDLDVLAKADAEDLPKKSKGTIPKTAAVGAVATAAGLGAASTVASAILDKDAKSDPKSDPKPKAQSSAVAKPKATSSQFTYYPGVREPNYRKSLRIAQKALSQSQNKLSQGGLSNLDKIQAQADVQQQKQKIKMYQNDLLATPRTPEGKLIHHRNMLNRSAVASGQAGDQKARTKYKKLAAQVSKKL